MGDKMRKIISLFCVLSLIAADSHSTITNQTVITSSALGNSSTTNFTIGFPFQANSQIRVYLQDESSAPYTRTLLSQGSGAGKYTFSSGDPATTVILGTAPSSTQRVLIRRVSAQTQEVNYDENAAFPFEDHEEQMDKVEQSIQELQYDLNNKIGLSTGSSNSVPVFPDPSSSRILGYNSGGTDLTLYPSSAPVSNDLLRFNGTNWVGYNLSNISGFSSIGNLGAASTLAQVNSSANAVTYGLLVDSNVSSSAAINRQKLATSTANYVVMNDQAGRMVAQSTVSVLQGGTGTSSLPAAGSFLISDGSSYVGGSTMPISWSGYHDITCQWTVSAGSGQNFHDVDGADASCGAYELTNTGFPVVTSSSALGGAASRLPQVTFTPPRTGSYLVMVTLLGHHGDPNYGGFRLADGNGVEIGAAGMAFSAATGSITLQGILKVSTLTSKTIKIQGASTGGATNVYIGDQVTGTFGNNRAISWTIVELR